MLSRDYGQLVGTTRLENVAALLCGIHMLAEFDLNSLNFGLFLLVLLGMLGQQLASWNGEGVTAMGWPEGVEQGWAWTVQ